jgi:DNA polymerase III subunit delta
MAAAKLKAVRRSIARGELDPVYYLTGDEDILKDELADAIVARAVEPSCRDFNVDVRSAGDLDAETLNALVETPPMLAERRVAVVRNLEQWRKNAKPWGVLKRYLERPSGTTTLVLIHGAGQAADKSIAKHAVHVAVNTPGDEEIRDWILDRAQAAGVTMQPEAADHLVAAVGRSLSHIASEVLKLSAASESGTVTVPDVEAMVGVRHGETLGDWVDAALRRNVPRAVSLLDVVLPQPGVTGVKMVATLGTGLVGARMARALLDGGKPSGAVERAILNTLLKTRPRVGRYSEVAAQWTAAAQEWSGPGLDRALRLVYEADQRLKDTTLSDARGIICSMLLQFSYGEDA